MKWTSVIGHPDFNISEEGDIVNAKLGKLVRQTKRDDGYMKTQIEKVTHYTHRLVYGSFNKCADISGLIVHHKNSVRDDNSLSNLELTTNAENSRHKNRAKQIDVTLTQYEINTLKRIIEKCKK